MAFIIYEVLNWKFSSNQIARVAVNKGQKIIQPESKVNLKKNLSDREVLGDVLEDLTDDANVSEAVLHKLWIAFCFKVKRLNLLKEVLHHKNEVLATEQVNQVGN